MKVKKLFSGLLSLTMIITSSVTPLEGSIHSLFSSAPIAASAAATTSATTTSVKNADKQISYSYEGVASCDYNFTYNDDMFFTNANEESSDLVKLSTSLAVSAYKEDQIKSCAKQMGFTNTCYNYKRKATYSDNDFVAFSINRKVITYNKEKYMVIIVPIRGTTGNCEWFSNFNLGTGIDHQGFYKAANSVLKKIKETQGNHPTDKNKNVYDKNHTIILTTGHSRGAAVANIVAGKLSVKGYNRVFGYTYACPAVSKKANTKLKNIRNYNNPGDVIASVPLSDWGFKRYGQDRTLDTSNQIMNNLNNRYYEKLGCVKYSGATEAAKNALIKSLKRFAGTQKAFNSDQNKFIFGVLAWAMLDSKSYKDSERKSIFLKLAHDCNVDIGFVKHVLNPPKLAGESIGIIIGTIVKEKIDTWPEYKDLNNLISEISKAEHYTANMDSKKFKNWLSSNGDLTSRIKESTGITIKNRSDLSKSKAKANAYKKMLLKWGPSIKSLLDLFYQTNGDIKNSITHAHTGETYIFWMNSMFYGYQGWAENNNILNVNIPEKLKIKRIDESCFYNCANLKELVIPDTVTSLENHAFAYCTGLRKVTIPVDIKCQDNSFYSCSNVQEIHYTYGKTGKMPDYVDSYGKHTSNNLQYHTNSLTTIYFDEGITNIGKGGFYGCQELTKVSLPSTLTSIGNYAFYGCKKLSNIKLPEKLKKLGDSSFSGCEKLSAITFPKNITTIPYQCFYNCANLKELVIPDTITSLENHAFAYCTGLKKVTIPVDIKCQDNSFYSCSNVQEIHYTYGKTGKMPDYVDSYGKHTSNNLQYHTNSLTTIYFDEGITNIGKGGFYGCQELTKVSLPSTLTSIGNYAFYGCKKLSNIKLPEKLKKLGDSSFSGCEKLSAITFPKNITTIPYQCFYNCANLKELVIPDTITSLENHAFAYCTGLKKVTIPVDIKCQDNSFYSCSNVQEIHYTYGKTGKMPDYVDSYGKHTSNNLQYHTNSLTTIYFDEGITNIGKGGFYGCQELTKVSLPSTLTSIGNYAFYGCKKLSNIKLPEKLKKLGDSSFSGCEKLSAITFPKNITTIPYQCFYNCANLKELVIPDTITSLENHAFAYCTGLKKVTIPVDIKCQDNSFCYCGNVQEIHYTYGKTGKMPDYTQHYPKENLTTVYFDEGITRIGNCGFSSCTKLTKVSLPSTLTSIGDDAFYDCENLSNIKLPEKVKALGIRSFSNCTSLSAITFPKNITTIPENCFDECNSLKELVIPDTITSLEDYAFSTCTGLKKVTIPVDIKCQDNSFCYCGNVQEIHYTYGKTGKMPDYTQHYPKENLTTVYFDEGITRIGNCGFSSCTKLTKVSLPSTLTSIGDDAFYGCTSLKDIYFANSKEQVNNMTIGSGNDSFNNAVNKHYNHVHACTTTEVANPTHCS